MELTVNGNQQTLSGGSTVSQLLDALQVRPERVVVELNLKILRRDEHARTILKDGDHVEIVRFVGGGAVNGRALERVAAYPLKIDRWRGRLKAGR